MLITAHWMDVREEGFGHTVEFDRVTGRFTRSSKALIIFVDFTTTDLNSPFVCLQTHIFTDGEDAELKKKIGKCHVGN